LLFLRGGGAHPVNPNKKFGGRTLAFAVLVTVVICETFGIRMRWLSDH
jgi:hypothetical protein